MVSKNGVFFDTNVLVYQFDKTAPRKQKQAIELIERYGFDGKAVISTQVAQEFMNVALRGFAVKLLPIELELVVDDLLKPLCHTHRTLISINEQLDCVLQGTVKH